VSDTNFIDNTTVVRASWLNEVNAIVHDIFDASATKADAQIALSLVVGTDVQAYDATILVDSDIGVNVQAYSADLTRIDTAIDATNADATAITIDSSENITFGGSVSLADNKALYIGNSNDFAISHIGTGSFVDNNTGILFLRQRAAASAMFIQQQSAGLSMGFECNDSGGTPKSCMVLGGATPNAKLYYDGVQVVATSATGFDLSTGQKLTMDRTTDDDGFINFQATIDADATSAISSHTTSGATTHHVQIDLNGTKAWIAVSTNNPSA